MPEALLQIINVTVQILRMYLGYVLSYEGSWVGRCTCSAKKILSLWLHCHESSQELDWFFVQEQISNSQSCNTTIWAWFWQFVCACLFLVCYPVGLSVTDFWTVLSLFLVIHYSSYRGWSSSVTFYRRCKRHFSHLSLLL